MTEAYLRVVPWVLANLLGLEAGPVSPTANVST